MADPDVVDATRTRARELFLGADARHGCAETAFVALKTAYGLPDPDAPGAAMALNGGIAYSGSTCGAITGAALAVGLLAEREIPDRSEAKRAARTAVGRVMAEFEATFGATTCSALTGADLSTEAGHRAFIEAGTWRTNCMRQIDFVVAALARVEVIAERGVVEADG